MQDETSPVDDDAPPGGADELAAWRREPSALRRAPLLPSAAGHMSPKPTSDWFTEPEPGHVGEPPSAPVMPVMPMPRRLAGAAGPVSPLRALAGAAVAVAGVLLGIGALLWATDAPKGSPVLQQTQAQSSQTVASAPPSASPGPGPVTVTPAPLQPSGVAPVAVAPDGAPKLPLTVLNNSNRTGLAARSAARFHAAGWPIRLTGSFRGRIPVTTVYFAPGQQGSALLLQRAFPAIERVRPRFSGLPGSGLTVVLTRTYPG